jgi:hypothetical protein
LRKAQLARQPSTRALTRAAMEVRRIGFGDSSGPSAGKPGISFVSFSEFTNRGYGRRRSGCGELLSKTEQTAMSLTTEIKGSGARALWTSGRTGRELVRQCLRSDNERQRKIRIGKASQVFSGEHAGGERRCRCFRERAAERKRVDALVSRNGQRLSTLSSSLRQAGANRARRTKEAHLGTNVVART